MKKFWSVFCLGLICCMCTVSAFAASTPAEVIASDYGVDKGEVQQLLDAGWNFEDVNRAAFFALAGQVQLRSVVEAKNVDGSWENAQAVIGLTDWHMEHGVSQLIAGQLRQAVGANPADVEALLHQRYHPKAIAIAIGLAQLGSSNPEEVLNFKKDGHTWYQTAEKLGLSASAVDELFRTLNDTFARRATFGDTFGAYGTPYGYKNAEYYGSGFDLYALSFAAPVAGDNPR